MDAPRFKPTTGFTYNFTAALTTGDAAHLGVSIYPPEAVTTGAAMRVLSSQ